MSEDGHDFGGRCAMVVDHIMHLAVNAAVNRVNQAVALAAAGVLKKVVLKTRSPPSVKTTSTGLSMPPVITGSIGPPSGFRLKI